MVLNVHRNHKAYQGRREWGKGVWRSGKCVNKSYAIATSDLRFFIHVSNLLPSTPHPTPLQYMGHSPENWSKL